MLFRFLLASAVALAISAPSAAGAGTAPATPASPTPGPSSSPALQTIGSVSVATKTRRPIATLPTQADLILSREIATHPGRTLESSLAAVPGYAGVTTNAWYYGQHGNNSDMRGLGPGSVLVLYDGVPINDPLGSWVSWSKVPKLLVDSIEASHGGASALYGSQALGGVLSLESVHPTKDSAAYDVFRGNLGTSGTAMAVDKAVSPKTGIGMYVDRADSKGYVRDTPGNYNPADPFFRYTGQRFRLQAASGDRQGGLIELAASGTADRRSGDLSGPTYYYGRNVMARIARESGPTAYAAAAYLTNDSYTFNRFSGTSGTTPNGFGKMSLDTAGLIVNLTRSVGKFAFTVGGDGRNVAGWRNEPRPATQSLYVTGNQQFAGGFLQADYNAGRNELTAAARYDMYSQRQASEQGYGTLSTFTNFPSTAQTHVSPRIAYRYAFSPHFLARASFGNAFKAPDWGALYSSYPGNGTVVGNPSLTAMSIDQREIGAEWNPDGVTRAYLTFYAGTETNRIVSLTRIPQAAYQQITGFVENVAPTVTTGVNVPQAKIGGYEFSLQRRIGSSLAIRASYANASSAITQDLSTTLLSILQCGSAAPNANCTLRNGVGNAIPQTPRTTADFSLRYFDRAFDASLEVRSLGRAFADEQNTQPIDGVVLFNAGLSRRLGPIGSAYLEIENVFNRQWMPDSTSFAPPRTIVFGLRKSL